MATIKVIELIGISTKSWEDAASNAIAEASKTVRNISGIDIVSQTAKVKDSKVVEYHAACKLAFKVD